MFDDKTPESIKEEILRDLTLADTREGSYTNEMVSPVAIELWKMYDSLNALIPIVYIDETSGEYIDKKSANYGIKRKAGTKSQATMHFAGNEGTLIPKGTVFLTADGLEFETSEPVIIMGGVANVLIHAIEVGEIYNVAAGAITQQIVSISGLTSFHNEAAVGGTNLESDKSLVERLYNYLRKPATSANVYHYEQWALEDNGVGGVKIIPLWNGPGTVKVLIVGPDKKPVDTEIVSNCSAHIESNRPIGADVTVISAEELEISIEATVTIDSRTTKKTVQEALKDRLASYLQSIAFSRYQIVYNRIAYMLLDIDGVIDYSTLTLNGGTENIIIGAEQIPVLGTVVIN
ncbi:baseplate J/gp47 family protein [Sedimentibacter sp.]|uniref:baseplate J/gp47 family protein n=1 Tax=Sedimentibacter sp. TaxID=1960295 RepID=UPI0028A721A2|nr:baseplate J/gp47 family protein [Sedimentibacter sp.]